MTETAPPPRSLDGSVLGRAVCLVARVTLSEYRVLGGSVTAGSRVTYIVSRTIGRDDATNVGALGRALPTPPPPPPPNNQTKYGTRNARVLPTPPPPLRAKQPLEIPAY